MSNNLNKLNKPYSSLSSNSIYPPNSHSNSNQNSNNLYLTRPSYDTNFSDMLNRTKNNINKISQKYSSDNLNNFNSYNNNENSNNRLIFILFIRFLFTLFSNSLTLFSTNLQLLF